LLYLTPVAYSATAVPDQFRNLYILNPVATLIEGLRWSLIGTGAPSLGRAAWSGAFCVIVFLTGCVVFTRLERGFADVI
jgi:lipopolysaccharide transport system permease protein